MRTWTPEQRATVAAKAAARRQARLENLEWLLEFDNNAESIVVRAGFKNPESCMRYLARAGRHDLASKLHPYVGVKDVYHAYYGSQEAWGAAA